MTALAHSLRRIWTAKNRVPHPTRWGTSGFQKTVIEETTLRWAREGLQNLIAVARRAVPTVVLLALNIFR
jgi:hypothetical protein